MANTRVLSDAERAKHDEYVKKLSSIFGIILKADKESDAKRMAILEGLRTNIIKKSYPSLRNWNRYGNNYCDVTFDENRLTIEYRITDDDEFDTRSGSLEFTKEKVKITASLTLKNNLQSSTTKITLENGVPVESECVDPNYGVMSEAVRLQNLTRFFELYGSYEISFVYEIPGLTDQPPFVAPATSSSQVLKEQKQDPVIKFCSSLFNAVKEKIKADPRNQQEIIEVIKRNIRAHISSWNNSNYSQPDLIKVDLGKNLIKIEFATGSYPYYEYSFEFSDQAAIVSRTECIPGNDFYPTKIEVKNGAVKGGTKDELQTILSCIDSEELRAILSLSTNSPLSSAETKQSAQMQQPPLSAPLTSASSLGSADASPTVAPAQESKLAVELGGEVDENENSVGPDFNVSVEAEKPFDNYRPVKPSAPFLSQEESTVLPATIAEDLKKPALPGNLLTTTAVQLQLYQQPEHKISPAAPALEYKKRQSELDKYHLTPAQSREHRSLDAEERKAPDYVEYAGILCRNLTEYQDAPGWFASFRRTTVDIKHGEVGLITHNGKNEFLKPGIYHLPSTTILKGTAKTTSARIDHENLTVVTVPEGHFNHVVNPANAKSAGEMDYYLLEHGRHMTDTKAEISRVVNPYGLEVSLDTNPRVFFARVCQGKVGFAQTDIASGKIHVYPVGETEVFPASANFTGYTFKDRLSTKVQSVKLRGIKVEEMQLDRTTKKITVDATVTYKIPDDTQDIAQNTRSGEFKFSNYNVSSVYKLVDKFGYSEDAVKDGIEKECKEKDENGSLVIREGLAIQEVKKLCQSMRVDELKKASKVSIISPQRSAMYEKLEMKKSKKEVSSAEQLRLDPAPDYTSPELGVEFLSVTFTKIALDTKEEEKYIERFASQISALRKSELAALDDKQSLEYKKIKDRVEEELLAVYKARIKELNGEVDVKSETALRPAANPYAAQNFARDEQRLANDKQREALHNIANVGNTVLAKRILDPVQSVKYFKANERIGNNYKPYSTQLPIPCVSELYLQNLKQAASPYKGTWFWLRIYNRIKNIMLSKTVEPGQIGLIRVNGKPEFLAPGKYYLPSAVEWVGTKNVNDKIIEHDSITVANIKSFNERIYVEDNTLCDLKGKIQSYAFLGQGVHVLDTPTMTWKELVTNDNAVMVKRSEDELKRIKMRKNYDSPEQDPTNKVLAVVIQPNEAGIYYNEEGELNVLPPGVHELKPEWTWYSRFSTKERSKQIEVEAYTFDSILVKVKTTVCYQIPFENAQDVILEFGINKIENEIERLAVEKTIAEIQSVDFVSNVKVTRSSEQKAAATARDNEELAQGPELDAAIAEKANTNALSNLKNEIAKGIQINSVQINSIAPVHSKIAQVNRNGLEDIARKVSDIERAVSGDPKIINEIKQYKAKIDGLVNAAKTNSSSIATSSSSFQPRSSASSFSSSSLTNPPRRLR